MPAHRRPSRRFAWTAAALSTGGMAVAAGYLGLVTGAVPIDLGIGRRVRPLGPFGIDIDAGREQVFDLLAAPYSRRPTRAMAEKVRVLARGSDLVWGQVVATRWERTVRDALTTVRAEAERRARAGHP
ncbi:MAG: hypothetical protein ACR2F6_01045 [Mycobacteriales bacterium]